MSDVHAIAEECEETPVFLRSDGATIFAVHTRPPAPNGSGFVHLNILRHAVGGSWGPKRFTVRLSRRIAAGGYDALRIDYRGVGESTGTVGLMTTTRPFTPDLDAGLEWLASRRIGSVVLAGTCFGGRTALAAAPEVAGLRGVVLIATSVIDEVREGTDGPVALQSFPWDKLRRGLRPRVIRGLLDPRKRRQYRGYLGSLRKSTVATMRARSRHDDYWVSTRFLEPLDRVVDRGVPVLFVYGTADWQLADFERARAGRLGQILDKAGPRAEVAVLEGRVHGAVDPRVDDAVIDLVADWVARLSESGEAPGSAATPAKRSR